MRLKYNHVNIKSKLKVMKKLVILSALAVFLIAPLTFGQKGKEAKVSPEVKKEKKLDRMDEELDLSDDQRKKIEAIHAKYEPQQEANKKEMEKLREERKKINEAKKAEMKAVLTPEQLKKMEELKKERQVKRKSAKKEVRKERMNIEEK